MNGQGDLTVTVRDIHGPPTRLGHHKLWSFRLSMLVLPIGGPVISFKAPPDDQMLIAVSEGASSGDEDSTALPPSGRVALPEHDPELTASPPRELGSSGGLHHVPSPQSWTIGFFLSGSA